VVPTARIVSAEAPGLWRLTLKDPTNASQPIPVHLGPEVHRPFSVFPLQRVLAHSQVCSLCRTFVSGRPPPLRNRASMQPSGEADSFQYMCAIQKARSAHLLDPIKTREQNLGLRAQTKLDCFHTKLQAGSRPQLLMWEKDSVDSACDGSIKSQVPLVCRLSRGRRTQATEGKQMWATLNPAGGHCRAVNPEEENSCQPVDSLVSAEWVRYHFCRCYGTDLQRAGDTKLRNDEQPITDTPYTALSLGSRELGNGAQCQIWLVSRPPYERVIAHAGAEVECGYSV
jgi:hypothetical protein